MSCRTWVLLTVTLFTSAACGEATSAVVPATAPSTSGDVADGPPTTAPAPDMTVETTPGVPAGSIDVPSTEPATSSEAPAYVTSEFAAGLAAVEADPAFSAGIPMLAAVPARFEDATPVLVAQRSSELGGAVSTTFTVSAGHSVAEFAEFPGGTTVSFTANPVTPEATAWLENPELPKRTVGELVLVQGADSAACGPVDEGGYSTDVYSTVVGDLLLTVHVSPVPGCQVAPMSVDDVAELFADMVVCQRFASTPTCRRLVTS